MFVIDKNPFPSEEKIVVSEQLVGSEKSTSSVWNDPDDQLLSVDLSSASRLLKLRKEADISTNFTVAGSIYESRLREQYYLFLTYRYERIHSRPAWADPSLSDSVESEDELTLLTRFQSVDRKFPRTYTKDFTDDISIKYVGKVSDASIAKVEYVS